MSQRLLIIGLDGFETRIAEYLFAEGQMPNYKSQLEKSGRFKLDHGDHKRTGLAWQHFAAGLSPDKSGIWSAVTFDPKTYNARQLARTPAPFLKSLGDKVVVLDAPYFDLRPSDDVLGFVNWGAHDPGVDSFSRPDSLLNEIKEQFGDYPAKADIYAHTWPSKEKTDASAKRLADALRVRSDVSEWVLKERLPDWRVALSVVSELHSAIEPMWHGFDETHPLHSLPSAQAAKEGLLNIYHALDEYIGRMARVFPDAAILLFHMHGMGPNDADAPSMILLPELMYQLEYGQPWFKTPGEWKSNSSGAPSMSSDIGWSDLVNRGLHAREPIHERILRRAGVKRHTRLTSGEDGNERITDFGLEWMPSFYYRRFWKDMRAFALPSYYDGRIRLNVVGREATGRVALEEYDAECARIERELLQVTNPRTGETVVDEIIRTSPSDPMAVPDTDGDIVVIWRGAALAFRHPDMKTIGPVPFRRTGGHTGGVGEMAFCADGIEPGDRGTISAFDVAPTIEHFLQLNERYALSGESALLKLLQPLKV